MLLSLTHPTGECVCVSVWVLPWVVGPRGVSVGMLHHTPGENTLQLQAWKKSQVTSPCILSCHLLTRRAGGRAGRRAGETMTDTQHERAFLCLLAHALCGRNLPPRIITWVSVGVAAAHAFPHVSGSARQSGQHLSYPPRSLQRRNRSLQEMTFILDKNNNSNTDNDSNTVPIMLIMLLMIILYYCLQAYLTACYLSIIARTVNHGGSYLEIVTVLYSSINLVYPKLDLFCRFLHMIRPIVSVYHHAVVYNKRWKFQGRLIASFKSSLFADNKTLRHK